MMTRSVSSPRKRGPITTEFWNMGPRFRGGDNTTVLGPLRKK
jgi:hypothetical protein